MSIVFLYLLHGDIALVTVTMMSTMARMARMTKQRDADYLMAGHLDESHSFTLNWMLQRILLIW